MKKNGFTLIELAAVIMILGIIMLIAVPIVLNTIENSKKGAAERSAENYLDTVETTVAWEKTAREIQDGEYTIQEDGSLCLDNVCTDENKIVITMSGNKPSSGTIIIENGQVVDKLSTDPEKTTTMTVNEYTVSYNAKKNGYVVEKSEESEKPEEGGSIAANICTYKGTDSSKKYAYGAEYECDPGDGVTRTFYMLEDGDNTTLTKGDGSRHEQEEKIGTAGVGQVSLIMNQNIGNTVAWCLSGMSNLCNGDGAKAHLESQTSAWTVEVSLPTYAQIYVVNNNYKVTSTPWLYDYLKNTTHPIAGMSGYWTASYTEDSSNEQATWVRYDGIMTKFFTNRTDSAGVRPVITVSKKQIG